MKIELSYDKGRNGECEISAELLSFEERYTSRIHPEDYKSSLLYQKIKDTDTLDVSYARHGSDALGTRATAILAEIVALSNVRELNLKNHELVGSSGLSIIEILCRSNKLECLDVSRCKIDHNIITAVDYIIKNSTIKKLNIEDNLSVSYQDEIFVGPDGEEVNDPNEACRDLILSHNHLVSEVQEQVNNICNLNQLPEPISGKLITDYAIGVQVESDFIVPGMMGETTEVNGDSDWFWFCAIL